MGTIHPLTILGLTAMACLTAVALASIMTGESIIPAASVSASGTMQQAVNAAPSTGDDGVAPAGHACGMHAPGGSGGCGCGG